MKFSNLQIGTRLGFGFGAVLLLMALLTAIGIWRLQTIAHISEALVATELRQDRYISEWLTIIEVNTARTYAAAKASNPTDEKFFLDSIAASSAHVASLFKQVEQGLRPEGKPLLADALEARRIYQLSRTTVFKTKAAGDLAAANTMFEQDMKPKLDAFVIKAKKLSQFQHAVIDEMGVQTGVQYREGKTIMLALIVLALLVGSAYSFWISRSITTPMRRAVQVAHTVTNGDLSSDIEDGGKDETGQLLNALKEMNGSLVGIVSQVRGGTYNIAHASREIASGNLDLSARTEQQASTLQESAAAIEQLTSAVRKNGDNARQALQLATSASDVASRGGAVVADVVATMGEINASSQKMADIIAVIDGIAFQTNILALNAAVEAARAGEQGRGFAVVASEVRNLAQRSAGAAKEIKVLIDNSVGRVDAGSKLVQRAGSTMGEIVASVNRVTDIIGSITAASQEQINGIEQINHAVGEMDVVTQQNAALVEEAAAAAESLQSQASALAEVVSIFKLDRADNAAPATATSQAAAVRPANRSTTANSNRQPFGLIGGAKMAVSATS